LSRKQEIIDAAAQLFAEHGFHGTSVQDLSKAVGLGKGALYHHIESKNELLYHIHERVVNPLLNETARSLRPDMDPAETLRTISRVLMQIIIDYRPYVTVFLHEWRALSGARLEEILEKRSQYERYIDDALQRGIDSGAFRVADVPLARLAFLGMHNYSYQWLDPAGRLRPEEIAANFTDIFLRGIENR
jgi:AcrR family transcriptional regulator